MVNELPGAEYSVRSPLSDVLPQATRTVIAAVKITSSMTFLNTVFMLKISLNMVLSQYNANTMPIQRDLSPGDLDTTLQNIYNSTHEAFLRRGSKV